MKQPPVMMCTLATTAGRIRATARYLATIAVVFLVACDPGASPVVPDSDLDVPVNWSKFDGSTDGNPDFWWLPELSANPDGLPGYAKSKFNPNLEGAVTISACEVDALNEDGDDHGLDCISPFLVEDGLAEVKGQKYNYKLRLQGPNVAPNKVQLITANVGEVELGYIHLIVGDRGGNFTVPQFAGDAVANIGSNVDVNMSIEEDALCIATNPDFVQGVDTCLSTNVDLTQAQTVSNPNGNVFVKTEAGTTIGGSDRATFTFRNDQSCINEWPFGLPLLACSQILVHEDGTFSVPTEVVDCSLGGIPEVYHHDLVLYQYTADGGEALPPGVSICQDQVADLRRPTSILGRFASAVRKLVGPQPLRATLYFGDREGVTGKADTYESGFGVSVAASMSVNGGDGLDVQVGHDTGEAPSVLVQWLSLADGSIGGPLPGATVTFDVGAGGGSINGGAGPVSVMTDADGVAGLGSLTAPGTAGTFTVDATSFGISGPDGPDTGPYFDADLLDVYPIGDPDQIGLATFTAEAFDQVAQQAGGPVIGIRPLGDGTTTIAEFYGYGLGDPPYNSSSTTGLEAEATGLIFAYDGSDADGLVLIHDAPGGTGGCIDFTFTGMAGLSFLIEDDGGGDSYTSPPTSASWMWNHNGSDGGVIGAFPRATSEDMTLAPDLTCGSNITTWTLLRQGPSGVGVESFTLDLTKALSIRGY